MINTRAQWKLLHIWIISVFAEQHLVQIDRIDGPTDYVGGTSLIRDTHPLRITIGPYAKDYCRVPGEGVLMSEEPLHRAYDHPAARK